MTWRDVEDLAALSQRRWPVAQSRYILLELQRMAAEKYAEARSHYELYRELGPWEDDKVECLCEAMRLQRDAAALSRLVRIGLGIEPAEGG